LFAPSAAARGTLGMAKEIQPKGLFNSTGAVNAVTDFRGQTIFLSNIQSCVTLMIQHGHKRTLKALGEKAIKLAKWLSFINKKVFI
jgi:hypothetical protein